MFVEGTIRILLIEDEEFDVRRVRSTLKPFERQMEIREVVSNGDTALDLLIAKKEQFDVVIMDLQIAGGIMGEALIRAIRQISTSLQIIVITKKTVNISDFDYANRLLQAGAFWYCTKYPSDIEEYIYQPTDFIISIFNAFQKKQLQRAQSRSEKKLLRNVEERLQQTKLLGVSPAIQKIRGQIRQLAATDATIIVSGPSGTGKELVATNIHYQSNRKLENFIPINCGSIPDDLVESELFGHEKGAFTGADQSRQGLFEAAHRGSIFLDEISELPLPAQVKLLRVIQEGEVAKIGRTEKLKVNVRIIAATNKILQQEVASGRFREDLFYRINVVPIFLPPLKERIEDIPVLWEHFMRQMSLEMGLITPTTDERAYKLLKSYHWPGNVRELKNLVQRLLIINEKTITADVTKELLSLPQQLSTPHSPDAVYFRSDEGILPLKDMERELRLKYFTYVRAHSNSDAEAAKKLGLAPPNYHRMNKDLGLK